MNYRHSKKFLDYMEKGVNEVLAANEDLTTEELEAKYEDILTFHGIRYSDMTPEEFADYHMNTKFYCYAINVRKGIGNIRQIIDIFED